VQTISSMAAASVPPPLAGTGLTACSNANAMSLPSGYFGIWSLKDAEVDREGNMSFFTALGYLFFY
jgi:hypothetical protein